MVILVLHLSVSVVLLVPQTDGRKPSFSDKSGSSFGCVRCTARPPDRRTNGNLASVISLARLLSVSVVLPVPQTDGRKEVLL